jgi:hypothetical protein
MMPVYIGVAALVVVIIAVFAFMRWHQYNALVEAYATPTPAASPVPMTKPMQLIDGEVLGKPMIKTGKLVADTSRGGLGQPVDGITCKPMEYATLHVHTHLAIFYHGIQVQVPRLIGAAPGPGGGCLYWIHTHAPDGIIHVESPTLTPPVGNVFTFGMLFDIWGEPLTRDDIAGLKGPVVAYVNGTVYTGNLRKIALRSHQQVVFEIGKPLVKPPDYIFPLDD